MPDTAVSVRLAGRRSCAGPPRCGITASKTDAASAVGRTGFLGCNYRRTAAKMQIMRTLVWVAVASLSLAACSGPSSPAGGTSASVKSLTMGELPEINTDALLERTKMLSSDEFEGRGPGTKGEELTVKY